MFRYLLAIILPKGRRTLFLLFFLLLLAGCSRYQFLSVSSQLEKNNKEEYINENDTVRISYKFSGENFPLTVTIYNKLSQPVYIDLRRSLVIMNSLQMNGTFDKEGQNDFIAPFSNVTLESNPLQDKFIDLNPADSLSTKPVRTGSGRRYSFSDLTTPLYFRIILALTPNEDYSYPTFYDYSFWVSGILETSYGPSSLENHVSYLPYIKKTTGFGSFMGISGLVGLLIISSAIAPAE